MKTVDLGNSKVVDLLFKPAGLMMGSRVGAWFMDPVEQLGIADVKPGQVILEVGCGTGFYTIPAAKIVGERGRVVAMDASSGFLREVARKVREADVTNVQIVQRDALDTGLEAGSMDKVLLFGVVPFPLLPLDRLLPEMHRVLKPRATMSVWLFPPLVHSWVPGVIARSDLFEQISEKKHIYNYVRKRNTE